MDKVGHGKTQTIRRKAAYTLRNLELEYPGRLGVKEVEVMIDQLAVWLVAVGCDVQTVSDTKLTSLYSCLLFTIFPTDR